MRQRVVIGLVWTESEFGGVGTLKNGNVNDPDPVTVTCWRESLVLSFINSFRVKDVLLILAVLLWSFLYIFISLCEHIAF